MAQIVLSGSSPDLLASGKSVLYTCRMAPKAAHGPAADLDDTVAAALRSMTSVADVRSQAHDGPDFEVRLADGQTLQIEVRATAHPTTEEASTIARRHRRSKSGAALLLVADKLSEETRKLLVREGVSFFDRRGHLVLVTPTRTIEADIAAAPRPRRAAGNAAVRGASGLSAGLAALLTPDEPPRVRETARAAGLSHTAISLALGQLRDANLVDGSSRAVLPDLFEAVVDAWQWPTTTDTRIPPPGDRRLEAVGVRFAGPFYDNLTELDIAVDHADAQPRDANAGWAMVGAQAAVAYGADVVVGRDALVSWIVPQDRYLTATRLHLQLEEDDGEPARLVAAPCLLAVRLRRQSPKGPLAHPLVVAIDLARDRGRGREILQTFNPPGVADVWR